MAKKKNNRAPIIKRIIERNIEGGLVKNKYKVIGVMLLELHPELNAIPKDKMTSIIKDAVNGNRDWQALTEGMDKENKEIFSQQWIVDNLM